MKKYIYILVSLLTIALCNNCQNYDNNKKFDNDEKAFIHTLEMLKKNYIDGHVLANKGKEYFTKYANNKDSVIAFFPRYKKENYAIVENINDIIKESKKVSDQYLDDIHPEFKKMYHEKFVAVLKMSYDIGVRSIKSDYKNEEEMSEMDSKFGEMMKLYLTYLQSIENDLKNHPNLFQAIIKFISDEPR